MGRRPCDGNRVLINHREHLPELYFNIIEREEKKVFLPIDTVDRKFGENYDDFIRFLDERGELVIRPDRTSANRCAYAIKRTGEDRYELKEDTACKARMSIFGNQYDAAYLLSDYPDDLPEDFEKIRASASITTKTACMSLSRPSNTAML